MVDEDKKTVMSRLIEGRGQAVRRAREAMGLSQAELAHLVGTSQQTVDRIERGIVEHSRAFPKIQKALQLAAEGFHSDEAEQTFNAADTSKRESYKQFMEEGRIISDISSNGKIPLFAPGANGTPRMVNAIPRAYPVEHVEGAFGLLMFGNEMEPAFRNGEIAIVNPILPPFFGGEVAVRIDNKLTIRTAIGETERSWRLRQWNPIRDFELEKDDDNRPQLVVAKIGRSI